MNTPNPYTNASGRFAKGNPGRPKGALNKLSSKVAHAIIRNFEANADDILDHLRIHHPDKFAQIVMRLVTKAQFVDDEVIEPLETDPAAQALTIGRRTMRARMAPTHVARCEFEAVKASQVPDGPSFYMALADRIDFEMSPRRPSPERAAELAALRSRSPAMLGSASPAAMAQAQRKYVGNTLEGGGSTASGAHPARPPNGIDP